MDASLISAFRERRSVIQRRWDILLRRSEVNTPLAHPDTLVFLIPSTLDTLFDALAKSAPRNVSLDAVRVPPRAPCTCGCNPYLPFFRAGEQAILETLAAVQPELDRLARREILVAEVHTVVRRIANSEIRAFCSVCTHRGCAKGCRFSCAESTASSPALAST